MAVIAGAGRLSRPSMLGLEGGWTPTLVVVSAAVINTGAGKKMEKKNSSDRLVLIHQTVAVTAGAKPGAGGLS